MLGLPWQKKKTYMRYYAQLMAAPNATAPNASASLVTHIQRVMRLAQSNKSMAPRDLAGLRGVADQVWLQRQTAMQRRASRGPLRPDRLVRAAAASVAANRARQLGARRQLANLERRRAAL